MLAQQPQPVIPLRAVLGLGAIVLIAHSVLLTLTPGSFGMNEPSLSRKFSTRTIRFEAGEPETAAPTVPAAPATRVLKPRQPKVGVAPSSAAINTVANPVSTEVLAPPPPAPAASTPAVAEAPAPAPAPAPRQAREGERQRAVGNLAIPGSVRLRYSVVGQQGSQPLAGVTSELLWLHDGKDYEARLVARTLFGALRTNTSVGSLGPEGLAPSRFSDKTRSEVAAHFERDKGKVTFSANTPDAPLLAGAQDRLSVILQLAALLAGEPGRYPVASTLTIQTIGPREADAWLFSVEGEEKLSLPAGEMAAVKLTRNPRREYDQRVELWFAPSLGWLPVRMKLTESNGNFIDQQLRANDKP